MKWPTTTLADICKSVRYGYTASANLDKCGPQFLRITDIVPDSIDWDSVPYCEIDDTNKERFTLDVDDIVIARTGATVGYAKLIREPVEAVFASYLVRFRVDSTIADPGYVGRLVESHLYKSFVQSRINGAAQPNASAPVLGSFEFPLPTRLIQQRIASILSTYDELIENNRRRMALLEDAARQVYQEWFVRLRFPGREHTRIVDGVPEGWEQVQLQSIINVTHGYAFQGSHFSENPTSRVLTTPGNFRIGGGIKFNKPKFYSEEGPLPSAYVFEPMDLMLTMTDLSQMCDTLGFPAFVPKLDGQTFLHNQRIGKIVPVGTFFPKHFLYCLLCDDRYRHHVVGAATGTSVKHTSPTRILSYITTIPKLGTLIDAFEDFARPLFQQINFLIETNQKLRTARDLLLPKLMKGEISV